MLFPFFPPLTLSPTLYHNTQGLAPTPTGPTIRSMDKNSNPHTPQTFSPSPHSTGMMCLRAHAASVHATHATSTNQMPASGRDGSKLLQGNFGGVFLGVVHVLSIVPVAGLDDVLTRDGDGRGPRGAAAAPVGYNVEYRRLHL